jgi:hypothetical protein
MTRLADLDVKQADRDAIGHYLHDRRHALRPKRCRCIGGSLVERDERLGLHCVRCGRRP